MSSLPVSAVDPALRRRRRIRALVGAGMAAFFVWLVVRNVDAGEALHALRTARIGPLLLCVPLLAADFVLRIVRWWCMLRKFEPTLPLRSCFGPFLGSYAVNNLLPMRAGDLVRVVAFRRRLRSPAMRLLGTLFIERLLDLYVLLALFFIGVSWLPADAFPAWFIRPVEWITGLGLVALTSVTVLLNPIRRALHSLVDASNERGRTGIGHAVRRLDQAVETLSLFRSPATLLELVTLSLGAWILEGAVFASVAWSLDLGVRPIGPWFATAAGTLATLIPSTPGYVGTFEYFTILAITAYGADRDAATVFAVLVHAAVWLPVTIAGGLFLLLPGGRSALEAARVTSEPVRDASR